MRRFLGHRLCVCLVGSLIMVAQARASETVDEASGESSSIRVQLKAKDQMVLSSQLSGRIKTLAWREGQTFKKGQLLVNFDCAIYRAKLNYALAAETAAQKKKAIAQRLDNLQSISVMEVSQAESDLIMAKAERQIGDVMVKRCAIKAPFSGRVSERLVEQGEFVSEGEPLLDIYDNRAYVVELIVPSNWVRRIKVGDAFKVKLDETAQEYPAKVTRLGAVIDPLSQSFSVFGQITSKEQNHLLPGMSGSALFAHQVGASP
ncbi:efflux RND transporter periplasmic adaptor subunit [Marinomonas transparens]|uniref:Efflux RND transporter periplasmic adaptor subunit n=1 Tax=Marinomonas transparens TaxID=2795388 RepID=A0A934N0Z3_9GAMM|nr:efflux RND transporter periplasmic adaptor subunit [Marinomonas transparens]MBJ7536153.1 efflux RND transporter periplasmic adaptor subunit [Marinomonas transparens]